MCDWGTWLHRSMGGHFAQGLVGAAHPRGAQVASGRWSLGRKAGPRPACRGVCGVCGGPEEGVGIGETGSLGFSQSQSLSWMCGGEAGTEVFLMATPGT